VRPGINKVLWRSFNSQPQKGGDCDAKIWVEPDVSIADSYGFTSRELSHILKIVTENRSLIFRAWHDHFSDGR
jgi:hypothetical protein